MSKTAPKWNVVKDALSPTHPPTATDPRDAVIAQLVGAVSALVDRTRGAQARVQIGDWVEISACENALAAAKAVMK